MKPLVSITTEKENILEVLKSGVRRDGRKFDEYRPIEIETGVYEKAEGSASVKIGGTFVAAGAKLGEGVPYPDSPDAGVLIVTGEMVPMASERFRAGPPDEAAIELARVVDRGIRESGAIDFSKLCITPGELVKTVFVDFSILDHRGNMFDTAALAAIAAVSTAKDADGNPLPVSKKPITNTFIKIGGNILLDPSLEEENVMDACFSVAIEDSDRICAMQKSDGSWTRDEIDKCIEIAHKRTKELRALIK